MACVQGLLEPFVVQAGWVERVAAGAVWQGQSSGGAHILGLDHPTSMPGSVCDRSPGGHQVGTHAVDAERRAHLSYLAQRRLGQNHLWQQGLSAGDPVGNLVLVRRPAAHEAFGVGLVGEPPPDHLDAHGRVAAGRDLDGEPEPVEQLWAQLALFGVHRADEHEAGRVRGRDALSLDGRAAHGCGVQQHVDDVVAEQVDLVDVQQPAVGRGEQAWLVRRNALGERPLQVQRPEHPVFGGADGQLDQAGRPDVCGRIAVRAVRAARVGRARVAREPAAGDDLDVGQQPRESPHHRRLGGALLAAHQHAADRGRDRAQLQRKPQVGQADYRGERVVGRNFVGTPHGRIPLSSNGSPRPSPVSDAPCIEPATSRDDAKHVTAGNVLAPGCRHLDGSASRSQWRDRLGLPADPLGSTGHRCSSATVAAQHGTSRRHQPG